MSRGVDRTVTDFIAGRVTLAFVVGSSPGGHNATCRIEVTLADGQTLAIDTTDMDEPDKAEIRSATPSGKGNASSSPPGTDNLG
jgi:hypothetical protein